MSESPTFSGLILLPSEANWCPSTTVCESHLLGAECCQRSPWPQPSPRLSQALFLSHSRKVAGTSDPQNFLPCGPQSPASPEPSQSLERTAGARDPFALPLWGLIPLTLCLTAPYLACQRSRRSAVSVPSACRIQSPSSDGARYSKQVMNEGVSTGSRVSPLELAGRPQKKLHTDF